MKTKTRKKKAGIVTGTTIVPCPGAGDVGSFVVSKHDKRETELATRLVRRSKEFPDVIHIDGAIIPLREGAPVDDIVVAIRISMIRALTGTRVQAFAEGIAKATEDQQDALTTVIKESPWLRRILLAAADKMPKPKEPDDNELDYD